MVLYHGSNVEVRIPRLLSPGRKLDFGNAFYLTSDLGQAARWAELTAERKQEGRPIISVYDLDDSQFQYLSVKHFDGPNAKWLKYVAMHRKGTERKESADVVIGPVANDQTSPVLVLFLQGELSVSETIRRLKPQHLTDQYAFKTEKALALLNHKETILK